jgi:hypothetical protein
MAGPKITFTPRDSSSRLITFDSLGVGVSEFSGLKETDAMTSFSAGGKAVTVIHDSYFVYTMKFTTITMPTTDDTKQDQLATLFGWISHAQAGGLWNLKVDGDKTLNTTLSTALAQGTSSIPVVSTAGIAVDDWIYLEHGTDPTRWEKHAVNAIGADITAETNVTQDFPAGSKVRHHELFVNCILVDPRKNIFKERKAGQGIRAWDLAFRFRETQ